MKTLQQSCDLTREDWLEADVVGSHVYISNTCAKNDGPNDIALTSSQARELAEWLSAAAVEADRHES